MIFRKNDIANKWWNSSREIASKSIGYAASVQHAENLILEFNILPSGIRFVKNSHFSALKMWNVVAHPQYYRINFLAARDVIQCKFIDSLSLPFSQQNLYTAVYDSRNNIISMKLITLFACLSREILITIKKKRQKISYTKIFISLYELYLDLHLARNI